ncbi:hypothetical protein SCQ05_15755 [Legionella pneumophila serogroup 1]|uniref:hypothetical protein n=1 Tax=Legionella pneumophila TaxID=446 RepID=UPI001A1A2BF5|nr:hypothetical protein [Legionella pneumophila]HAT2139547.1 hypothetical protein [Legionella pneumophila]HAT7921607.1 hypothetical protein [Legionella pneumophila]HAT8309065.1 hypothetical protein [Legionella pneumophila]HAU1061388.1 hypothetical protein [Legionella pneumophila]
MILKHTNWYKKFLFLLGIVLSLKLMAIPPGEVVDACIESIAIDYGMTFTEIAHPTGKEEELCEGGPAFDRECYMDMDIISENIHYGRSECCGVPSVFINGHNLSLKNAQNFSINPYIKPGAPLSVHALWFKIGYRKKTYLCIVQPLSEFRVLTSGEQYYIIENVMPFDIPVLYYYLFETDMMPLTMSWSEQEQIKKEFPFFKFSTEEDSDTPE